MILVVVLILRLKGVVYAGTTKEIIDNLDLAK